MKKFFKKNSELKLNEVRQELSRAYLMIAILSIVSIILFKFGSYSPEDLAPSLVVFLIVGLSSLAMVTLFASFAWINCKNKK